MRKQLELELPLPNYPSKKNKNKQEDDKCVIIVLKDDIKEDILEEYNVLQ